MIKWLVFISETIVEEIEADSLSFDGNMVATFRTKCRPPQGGPYEYKTVLVVKDYTFIKRISA